MEPDVASESLPAPETPKPNNFFRRLGGVYSSPRGTFEEIGQAPAVWVPLLILLVISLLVGFYLSRTLDLESMAVTQLEAMVQQGGMTQQQMEERLPMAIRFAGIQLILMATIGSLFTVLAVAGYAKLFSVFAGAKNQFKPILSVTIYVMIAISIVQSALTILVLRIKGAEDVTLTNMNSLIASNLGAILTSLLGEDALPKLVIGLANAVDAFAIWTIVLLAIGYSVVSKKLKTSTAAFWLAIAYAIISVLSAVALNASRMF